MKGVTKSGVVVEIEEVICEGREMALRMNGASFFLFEIQYSGSSVDLRFRRGGKLDALLTERRALEDAIAEAQMVEGIAVDPPALTPPQRA